MVVMKLNHEDNDESCRYQQVHKQLCGAVLSETKFFQSSDNKQANKQNIMIWRMNAKKLHVLGSNF